MTVMKGQCADDHLFAKLTKKKKKKKEKKKRTKTDLTKTLQMPPGSYVYSCDEDTGIKRSVPIEKLGRLMLSALEHLGP